MAKLLLMNAPYKNEALELINYFDNNFSSDFARVFVCSSLFHKTESMLLGENSLTVVEYTSVLKSALELAKKIDAETNEWKGLNLESIDARENSFTLEEATQSHYGDLFSDFDNDYYFNTPTELLKLRFARNDIDYEFLVGSRALDCGCGNGKHMLLRNDCIFLLSLVLYAPYITMNSMVNINIAQSS